MRPWSMIRSTITRNRLELKDFEAENMPCCTIDVIIVGLFEFQRGVWGRTFVLIGSLVALLILWLEKSG
jgi:hypothetical protein